MSQTTSATTSLTTSGADDARRASSAERSCV